MKGLVIKSTGSFATVRTEKGNILDCRLKGVFRKDGGLRTTNPVAVGDRVEITSAGNGETPWITEIEDRDNYLIRKSINLSKEAHVLAANIDRAYVVVTLHSPRTSMGFIDRVLLTCEAYHISAAIVINKADLYQENEKDMDLLAAYIDVYETAGYPVMLVSAASGMNLDLLKNDMTGKICLFTGHSGSGKSSLVNRICPGLELKTAGISDAHNKGRHTTTFAELHEVFDNTYIIDTPGVKEFGVIDMDKTEIRDYFREFPEYAANCKFSNCMHVNEPQ
ncbi:MAG: ribosome small subunit-dependent GTPase A, partial [Bacteroidia bacterium]